MKYLKEIAIIFGITLVGELLNHLLPLPVPAGVYGLFILLVCLCTGLVKLSDVEVSGGFLLDIMPIMFVPPCVSLLDNYAQLQAILIPVVVISLVSTIIVMVVTGHAAQAMMRFGGKKTAAQTRGGSES